MDIDAQKELTVRLCTRLVHDADARRSLGQVGLRLLDDLRKFVRAYPATVFETPDQALTIEEIEFVLAAMLGHIVGGIDDAANAGIQYERIQRLTHVIAFAAALSYQLDAGGSLLRHTPPVTPAVN